MGRRLQPCGTWAAYKRHLKAGEEPCRACVQACRRYARERYWRDPETNRIQKRVYLRRRRALLTCEESSQALPEPSSLPANRGRRVTVERVTGIEPA